MLDFSTWKPTGQVALFQKLQILPQQSTKECHLQLLWQPGRLDVGTFCFSFEVLRYCGRNAVSCFLHVFLFWICLVVSSERSKLRKNARPIGNPASHPTKHTRRNQKCSVDESDESTKILNPHFADHKHKLNLLGAKIQDVNPRKDSKPR